MSLIFCSCFSWFAVELGFRGQEISSSLSFFNIQYVAIWCTVGPWTLKLSQSFVRLKSDYTSQTAVAPGLGTAANPICILPWENLPGVNLYLLDRDQWNQPNSHDKTTQGVKCYIYSIEISANIEIDVFVSTPTACSFQVFTFYTFSISLHSILLFQMTPQCTVLADEWHLEPELWRNWVYANLGLYSLEGV